MAGRGSVLPALAASLLLTGGCGGVQQADPPPDGLIGRVVVGPYLDGYDALDIRAVVDTGGDCVTVRFDGTTAENGFIWPNGTGWDSERGVVLPNGRTLSDGDPISGGGGYHTVETDGLATAELVAAVVQCGWDPAAETLWLQVAG